MSKSITCPQCGIDIETDDEIQSDIIEDMPGVVAVPIDTIKALKQEIEMLNGLVEKGLTHTDRSKALTEQAFVILGIMLDDYP